MVGQRPLSQLPKLPRKKSPEKIEKFQRDEKSRRKKNRNEQNGETANDENEVEISTNFTEKKLQEKRWSWESSRAVGIKHPEALRSANCAVWTCTTMLAASLLLQIRPPKKFCTKQNLKHLAYQ